MCATDTSILHYAFTTIFIALWAVISRYVTILMAILSYFTRFNMKRENVGSWNSGLEKEQILEAYSAQLQKSRKFTENNFGIYKKYWAKKIPYGTHQVATSLGACPTPQGAPLPCGPPVTPLT